jgi:hypothetical protein
VERRCSRPGSDSACAGVRFAYGNGRLVGIRTVSSYYVCSSAEPRDTRFLSFPDGVPTYSGRTPGLLLNSICYANRKFVAVGDSGVVATSTTGTNWNITADARPWEFRCVLFQTNVFVAVADGAIGISSNASAWTIHQVTNEVDPVAQTVASNLLRGVAYGNGRWVAAGPKFSLTSTNLKDWMYAPDNTGDPSMNEIAFGNGIFVQVRNFGPVRSATGSNWVSSANPFPAASIAFGAGMFVAVGNNGLIRTATNGNTWTARASGISENFTRVAFGYDHYIGSNSFVAVTTNGAWFGSGDAVTWYPLRSGFGPAQWFLLNADGQFIAGANGFLTTFSGNYQCALSSITDAAFGFGTFLAVGPFGIRHLPRTWPPTGLIIAQQPQSRAVLPGVSFQLGVSAYTREKPDGFNPAIAYQWRREGTNLAGATNWAIQFSAAATEVQGQYDVILSDRYSSVTSAVAVVELVFPELNAVRSNSTVTLSFRTLPEVSYRFEQRDSLNATDQWETLTNYLGDSSVRSVHHAVSASMSNRFFRVSVEP